MKQTAAREQSPAAFGLPSSTPSQVKVEARAAKIRSEATSPHPPAPLVSPARQVARYKPIHERWHKDGQELVRLRTPSTSRDQCGARQAFKPEVLAEAHTPERARETVQTNRFGAVDAGSMAELDLIQRSGKPEKQREDQEVGGWHAGKNLAQDGTGQGAYGPALLWLLRGLHQLTRSIAGAAPNHPTGWDTGVKVPQPKDAFCSSVAATAAKKPTGNLAQSDGQEGGGDEALVRGKQCSACPAPPVDIAQGDRVTGTPKSDNSRPSAFGLFFPPASPMSTVHGPMVPRNPSVRFPPAAKPKRE
ncbi:hypothetical protein GGTG_00643 [Gaeumannomyces tritici R3-111a-1]|uniref:Uncharacterized protein n=1 Tax=Gaeumannomyces tritici (strain R3-111a-1) TaxID=644352 RepID=J3NHA6_GAET3|nr:hypothetical protein GGTG_00643 [Gaeumannomyces tritici R3-111a-1]EJT80649.1 hypothetical protein GGTG_00643 [Gaeumannomyces tritici R3-111a-1]